MILVEELFKETFGLALVLQIPWNTALHLAGPETTERLDNLRPEILV